MLDPGLQQDPLLELAFDPDRLNLRRKAFYCVYALDRWTYKIALETEARHVQFLIGLGRNGPT
jgi:hypothetical protein